MLRSRSESAMTSEPQPGAFAAVRLAGRSIAFRDGWASVVISAAGAAFAVAVLTGLSLGFQGKIPPPYNRIGGLGATLPRAAILHGRCPARRQPRSRRRPLLLSSLPMRSVMFRGLC